MAWLCAQRRPLRDVSLQVVLSSTRRGLELSIAMQTPNHLPVGGPPPDALSGQSTIGISRLVPGRSSAWCGLVF
jgi:hypothetical protein